MAYVYRFLNSCGSVIYVGYTGNNISTRINQHLTRGHLPSRCYREIAKIECIHYNSRADAQIAEVYYINKHKPIYNKLNKQGGEITLKINEKEWKTFKEVKKIKKISKEKRRLGILIWLVVLIIYIKTFIF